MDQFTRVRFPSLAPIFHEEHDVTVGELTRLLKGQPEDKEIILSVDSEGNNFRNLDEISTHYLWWPEAAELWDVEDRAGEKVPGGSYPVLVLWPR